ncbi:MAG: SurA N-terminal domain-containing protein [Pseudomonadota bacterium]
MLTLLRNMLRSKLGLLVFALIIVAMAGWGMTDVFSGNLGSNLAVAGKRTLTDGQFDAAVERELRTRDDGAGRSLTKEQALEQGLIDQIYNREQFRIALRAYGDALGITATPEIIQRSIEENPAFSDTTGLFDQNNYFSLIDSVGYSDRSFRDTVERDLTISRLQRMPGAGLTVPNALARIEASYNGELRSASWFTLREDMLPEIGEPTEEELLELYEERTDALREPQRRQITLLRMAVDDFTGGAEETFSEDDLIGFYEAYRVERYTGPDTRVIAEFRFANEDDARAALGQIAGGANADQIPALLSSNIRATQIDGISDPNFAQRVFSRGAGVQSIHGPAQINGAWVIVQIQDIIEGEATPYEAVREQILNELARDVGINEFYKALPRFDDLIGSGSTLEEIGLDLGVPVFTFAPVDERGVSAGGAFFSPLTENPNLLRQAFTRAEGRTTERFGDQEVSWMARVDSIIPERMPEFEEVRDRLAVSWRLQKQADQMQTVAGEIKARIDSGETVLNDEAARFGATIESTPRPLSRSNPQANLPRQLINGLFEAREEQDILTGPGLPGQTIILQVSAIDRPEAETVDILAETTAIGMRDGLANDLFDAFFLEIQSETKLEANAAALANYKRGLETVE